ncbi:hypothetical protein Tco_0894975 [Tanacetum coccineum]|uniref:Gag-Pol polyprotein n=1 Tax=Tanacetum coccineum TaxID=301880 RepID=A0ABQ5CFW9_9ASTR
MSTQQDIYAAGFENCPHMLNKENYVHWSSCLLRYANSRPNGMLIYNSIMNGPYVRRMIPELGYADREVPVKDDDQAIQTILLGLPDDIYAVFDSCETVQEIWFTSTDGESIESYYHHFLKLRNDFKRNKHFPKKIASNLKFLENLQPEWSRHVTIIHQTKDSHTADYTQFYDFLKYNQKKVDDLRAERLAKTHDPLALMANSNNPFNYLVFHQDQPSSSTYMQQPMTNPEDIIDPINAMNMALVLMAKPVPKTALLCLTKRTMFHGHHVFSGDVDREVLVNETFHEQTDDELTEKELKQAKFDDQAILTILLGLPEDIYADVDSFETAQEIWLRVQQMMKGSDIRIQEKKAKLFNEWERFTSTNGESIESYYHHF